MLAMAQLQRIGRTGRKRDGYVHVLLSEDREERNWEKADDNYKDVQRFILKAEHLELYADVERLIPQHIKPECVEMVMEIEEYVREEKQTRASSPPAKAKKRARNDDMMRNIPDGASTGFVSVKDLLAKGGKKRKKPAEPVDFDQAGISDDEDREIEAGIMGPRRTASMPTVEQPKAKKPRRTKTVATDVASSSKKTTAKANKKGKQKVPALEELTLSQLDKLGQDDSEDEAIERGVSAAKPSTDSKSKGKTTKKARPTPPPPPPPLPKPVASRPSRSPGPGSLRQAPATLPLATPATPSKWSSSLAKSLGDVSIIDLTTPGPSAPRISLSPPRWSSPEVTMAPEREHDLDVHTNSATSILSGSDPTALRSAIEVAPTDTNDDSMAWLIEDDEDPDIELVGSSPSLDYSARDLSPPHGDSSELEIVDNRPPSSRASARIGPASASHDRDLPDDSVAIPPPRPLANLISSSPQIPPAPEPDVNDGSSDAPPPATFAVRAPGNRGKKRSRIATIDSSPLVLPPPSQRRLHRADSRPRSPSSHRTPSSSEDEPNPEPSQPRPLKHKKRTFADTRDAQRHNPWIDVEAAHSGDEDSVGGSEDYYEEGPSDGDVRFAGNFAPTQASPSYDQAAVYRRSLMTQAGSSANMPVFANRPLRRGLFRVPQGAPRRGRVNLSSSPPRQAGSEDEYELGTFVVDDDAEISYTNGESISSDL
jgi:ATP-dependent DNA helicase MPH1